MTNMTQLRASRLSKGSRRRKVILGELLPPGSTKRKLAGLVGVPLFVCFLGLLIVDMVVMPSITRHGDEFPLPDFVGMRLIEAQLPLEDLELGYEVASQEYSPGKGPGVILNQFPMAGTRVKSGRPIKFVVSLGQKMVSIPSLAGKSVRQALLDLETAGLELGEIAWAFSDTLPEKVVVFSYPPSAAEIPLGSPVNLMVNRGRASRFTYTPRLVGLTIDEAVKRLEDKSLKVGIVTYRTDENYLPETVLEQSEREGTELDVGTEIDLVVSTTE